MLRSIFVLSVIGGATYYLFRTENGKALRKSMMDKISELMPSGEGGGKWQLAGKRSGKQESSTSGASTN